MARIQIYDTTLRDGSQGEGVNFSLQDKLLLTKRLDDLGVDFVEGGYPLSNPKDADYFREVKNLDLKHAKVAAFGMTRRKDTPPERDTCLKALPDSEAPLNPMNGLGERCGNADLVAVIANLVLKQGHDVLKPESLQRLTETSRYVYELANMNFRGNQPFVGASAFAHKGGMHTHAVARNPKTYEHVDPALVGNERRVLLSELSGQSTILTKTAKYSITQDKALMAKILAAVQNLENEGYEFEAAEASFDLLVKKLIDQYK